MSFDYREHSNLIIIKPNIVFVNSELLISSSYEVSIVDHLKHTKRKNGFYTNNVINLTDDVGIVQRKSRNTKSLRIVRQPLVRHYITCREMTPD